VKRSLISTAALIAALGWSAHVSAFEAGAGANDGGSPTNTAIGDGFTNIDPTSTWATAIGYGAEVQANSSGGTTLGFDAKVHANAPNSTAVGTRSDIGAGSFSSTALGDTARIGAGSQESTAIGQGANIGDGSFGSIAVGHGATVSANTSRGMAIGDYAETAHANSVALGGESKTQRGGEAGYTAFGLAAPQDSVGEVGIGTKNGGNRTITGVAAGYEDHDAVNVQQLRAVDSFAVKYDESAPGVPDYTSITLGQGAIGANPVVIHNVDAGEISATSYDAVNGAQIHAVSTSVAGALGGGAGVAAGGTVTAPSYVVQGATHNDVGSAISALDAGLSNLSSQISVEAGKAGAVGLAAAALRFDDRAGKLSVALGGGVWDGQGAMALGTGYTSIDQRIRANVTGATTGDKWGASAGVSFTLN
jgi:autotransporter adhesin